MVLLCPQRAPTTTDPCRTPKLAAGPASLNVSGNRWSFHTTLQHMTSDLFSKFAAPRDKSDCRVHKILQLVTDGNTSYPPCASALGVSHEARNQSSEECVRGEFHIQNVNNSPASRVSLEVVDGSPQNILPVICVGIISSSWRGTQLRGSASPALWVR